MLTLLLACAHPLPTVEATPPPASMVSGAPVKPWPPTERRDVTDVVHGTTYVDPYRWLEDEKSPEVQTWMGAQDTYTRGYLGKLPGRDALAARFKALYYVDAVGVPVLRGGRAFYMRTFADKEKAILYLRDAAGERVVLDPNTWTGEPVSLGRWVPSWDGKRLAYGVNPNHADEAILHVLDVDTGKELGDVIPGAKYAGPDWTPDGKGFYYEWLPTDPAIPVDARPGYTEIRYHALGTDPATDRRVHEKTGNPETFLGSDLSKDGRWHTVTISRGWNASDVYLQDLSSTSRTLVPLAVGQPYTYAVSVWKDQLYILTNEGASRYRVYKAPAATPQRANWKEIVPEDPKGTIVGMNLVGGRIALSYLVDVVGQIRLVSLDGAPQGSVALPGVGSVSGVSGLPDVDEAYFSWSSFTSPQQVYKLDVPTGKVTLWAEVQLPIDPSPYVVEQVWYPSKDGTSIPMFLVRRKDAAKDGSNRTLLYGYGGFNVAMKPAFRSSIYPWLEAGGIYAVANLRGGSEFGEDWHKAGMLDQKQNVFDDFIAAGQYLVREGWTRPSRLGINGGSNGGLLMGAAVTQAPEQWGAVVCAVPLLDMLRYHLFGSGRTWIPEYGTAENAQQYAYISRWSPYQRIKRGTAYPAFLMDAADHDDRVDPMHARKFAAALQDATSSNRPVLLRIEADAGHGGADKVSAAVERSTDVYSFLLSELR